jgi:NADH-quinone oxidoreductase subunit N
MNMNANSSIGLPELYSLLPLIAVAASSLVLMLSAAWHRCRVNAFIIMLVAFGAAFAATCLTCGAPAQRISDLFIIDAYGRYVIQLILLATLVIAVFAHEYLRGKGEHTEEFYIALSVSCLGALVMAVSNHFVGFFLGLELMTVPIYCMTAYFDQHSKGLEASLKYIVLAGASAAFLLFGMALIYAQLGTMQFDEIAERLTPMWSSGRYILLAGFAFLVVGVGFKLSMMPFHMWTPDVYEGAPLPVTAYLATVSKGAMMALFLRFFMTINARSITELESMLSLIAILSMFGGNWLALMQKNVKRLLAYSSIAHVGYMFVAFLSSGPIATGAVLFYLTAYFATSLLAFGSLLLLDKGAGETETVEDLRGLYYTRPYVAGALALALLSLVGIPLSAGFMGKYFLIIAGINTQQWPLLFSLVASSVLGLYAYLKVVLVLFQSPTPSEEVAPRSIAWSRLAMLVLALGVLMLGLFPNPIVELIRAAT